MKVKGTIPANGALNSPLSIDAAPGDQLRVTPALSVWQPPTPQSSLYGAVAPHRWSDHCVSRTPSSSKESSCAYYLSEAGAGMARRVDLIGNLLLVNAL